MKKIAYFVKNRITKVHFAAGISVVLFGVLAHGYMLNNKLCYHDDDISYFHLGGTFGSGRWLLGIFREVGLKLGLQNYSTPLWNGIWFLFFLALSAVLLVEVLQIRTYLSAVLMGAVLAVFPTVTSIFAYMFTAPYYGLSIFLMILAVFVSSSYRCGFGGGIVLIAFSMGIYQAYFGIATTLFVLLLVKDDTIWKKKVKTAFVYFFTLLGGMIGYILLNKISLVAFHEELYDYQGIDQMSSLAASEIIHAIIQAYKSFVQPMYGDLCGISNTRFIHILFVLLFALGIGLLFYEFVKKDGILERILQLILYGMIPLSVLIVYVMAGSERTVVHTVMIVPYVFVILYPVVFIEKYGLKNWIASVYYILTICMVLFYGKLDNTAYLKMTHEQEAAISYYTSMISAIKSADGYSDELPVLIYGNSDGMDHSIAYMSQFDEITLQGYKTNENEFIAYYADSNFIRIHCGYDYYSPSNRSEIIATEEFLNMPCYPKDGSVQNINDVMVVKLSESE